MKMRDARSLPPVAQEDLRRKGIQAIRAGDSVEKVARRFGVSRQAVYNWVGRFESGGVPALRARKRGRAPARKLVGVQAATIVRLIKDRHPDQLKLPFYLWTREAVQALIRRKFNVEVSVWTVGRYLKRWGFTSQKPARRALEQNREQVQRWLAEEYPAIRAAARRKKAEIYWGDEMGLRSDHAAGRRRAKDPAEPVSNVRGYLRSTQRQPQIVRNYFQAKHIRYAAV